MVQISIKSDSQHGGPEEYFIIELQGDLLSKCNSSLADSFIGALHFTKEDIPVLIVGHHILYGVYMPLDKPLAILYKHASTGDQPIEGGASASQHQIIKSTMYSAQAVVRRKLVFRQRPKPIVTKTER